MPGSSLAGPTRSLRGERKEARLVEGVGAVGHQLAQEDLTVGVDGVNHEVQQLLDLCLEAVLAHRDLRGQWVRGGIGKHGVPTGNSRLRRPPAQAYLCRRLRPRAARTPSHTR